MQCQPKVLAVKGTLSVRSPTYLPRNEIRQPRWMIN
jgi:hypothetical protein